MKLVNRIFVSVVGLIVFSTLASTILGTLLISDAVRSEAISRVELGLKEARSELEDRLDDLSFCAQITAEGLENRLEKTMEPDAAMIFPGDLPRSLTRRGLAAGEVRRGRSGSLPRISRLSAIGSPHPRHWLPARKESSSACSPCIPE